MTRRKLYITIATREQILRWISNCSSEECMTCIFKEPCVDAIKRLDLASETGKHPPIILNHTKRVGEVRKHDTIKKT